MSEPFDVLACGAHPDDVDTACGGLLALLVRRGYRVAICDLTRGELGSNGSPEERDAEAQAAAKVLGVHARFNLGLPDGGVRADDDRQRRAMVTALRTHRPRLLIGPDAAARHPDHIGTAMLLQQAQFWCGVHGYATGAPAVVRPVLVRALDYYPMQPSFVVDVTDVLEIKLRALRCYRSQFERDPNSVPTVLNDPAYLQRVETQARAHGLLIGRPAGEPYAVQGPVPLADPVAVLAPVREAVP